MEICCNYIVFRITLDALKKLTLVNPRSQCSDVVEGLITLNSYTNIRNDYILLKCVHI